MTVQMYRKTRRDSTIPRIRMGENVICFNRAAADQYMTEANGESNRIRYVELGWDPDTQEVVLYPKKKATDFTISVQSKKNEAAVVAVYGFIRLFSLESWKRCLLIISKKTKTELRLKKGEKTEFRSLSSKSKTNPPIPPPSDKQPKGERDYQCKNCGYHGPMWKYQKSMKGIWHPARCKKCGCEEFVLCSKANRPANSK